MYGSLNTNTPQGWQPRAGLRGLGQDEPLIYGPPLPPDYPPELANPDADNPAAWYDLRGQLESANSQIRGLEESVRLNPEVAAAISRDVARARNDFTDLAVEFTRGWTLMFGEPPTGLEGLGIAPAALAIIFTTILYGLYVLNQYIQSLIAGEAAALAEAQRKQTQATTQQQMISRSVELEKLANAAEANGDLASARQYREEADRIRIQAGSPVSNGAPGDWSGWLQKNAMWLGLGAGILFLGPPLIQGLLPGKRR